MVVVAVNFGVYEVGCDNRQKSNDNLSRTLELTEGSKDMMRTVLSLRPTAKNHALCSPVATEPSAMQDTSDDNFFLSVYSFNWPVCKRNEYQ